MENDPGTHLFVLVQKLEPAYIYGHPVYKPFSKETVVQFLEILE